MDQRIASSHMLCSMDIPNVKHILVYMLADYHDSLANMSKWRIRFVKLSNDCLDRMVIDRMD